MKNPKESKELNNTDRFVILWMTLWVFTMAFAHLGFGQSVLAMVIWPYYLGETLAKISGA
jgi:hypothetical protein